MGIHIVQEEASVKRHDELRRLLARCYHKLGKWQENLYGISEKSIPNILEFYLAATLNDSNW